MSIRQSRFLLISIFLFYFCINNFYLFVHSEKAYTLGLNLNTPIAMRRLVLYSGPIIFNVNFLVMYTGSD